MDDNKKTNLLYYFLIFSRQMNSLLSSNKDGYYQSTSLNIRSSQASSLFNQLIDNLINNLFLYQSENAKLSKELMNSDDIHKLFNKIEEIINQQYPQNKRSNALAILSTARTLFLHLIFLRNRCEPGEILTQQIETVLDALQQTTKYSHDQFYGPVKALENRKLQISLGLVEALTEMLVLDIEVFGIQLNGYEKCSKLRRSIGNSLMNLVYQQREAKHKLCTNAKFLRKIAEIIVKTNSLVQFYAGLIQNISYNADQRIATQISITVHPLVCAAVQIAYGENESKFDLTKMQSQRRQNLLKILSALWNLAEDPIENKHVMCNMVPQFVPMLLKIMFSDQRELPFIQSAAGILKHLCTFILQNPDLFAKIHKKGIFFAFIRQFSSSSPDLVTDSINALCILSSHPFIAREILAQETYIQQINYLVRSTNEGISRASRTLLDTIYSASIFYQFKTSSRPAEMCFNSTSMQQPWPLKQQINERDQTNHHNQNQHLQYSNYSTLPTTFQYSKQQIHFNDDHNILHHQQNTQKGVLKQQNQPVIEDLKWQLPDEIHKNQKMMENSNKKLEEDISNAFIDEPSGITGGHDLPTSVQCTREVSPRSSSFNSINNDEKNGWNSVQSTSVRSSGMQSSTASASELPDSPSQWATQKVFQLKEMELQILKALDENKQSGQCTNANVSGDTENNQANIEPGENKGNKMDEEEIGGLGPIEEEEIPCLLTQVIRDYMPKPGQNAGTQIHLNFNPTQNSTPILTPISSNSPCKSPIRNETMRKRKGGAQYLYGGGNECFLLEQSIAAVMPHRLFLSRNTSGGSSDKSPNNLMKHNNSEDDDLDGRIQEEILSKFPLDVTREFEAELITVDCDKISPNKGEKKELESNKCGSTSEKNSQQKEKLRSLQKLAKAENYWSKIKKNGPPPLAPKPKLIQPQKMKRSPGSSNNAKGSSNESSSGQTKIVSL